jgi:hypothetical protein
VLASDWNAVLAIEPCNPTAQSAKTSLSVRIQERNEKMKAEMLGMSDETPYAAQRLAWAMVGSALCLCDVQTN